MTIKELADIIERRHKAIEDECVTKHFDNFDDCDEPGCRLLRELGKALGWELDAHHFHTPTEVAARDWMKTG